MRSPASKVRKQRVDVILPILKKAYPDARCSLNFSSPLQLLVATILSAQCTDNRVNIVTQTLFKRFQTARDYADSDPQELESIIQSTGFFRAKARNIRAMAHDLVTHHGGEVPRSMDDLVKLAGVGRKTANVVLGNAFDTNVGVTVDTHVGRLSNRLGLTTHQDPVKIEQDLMKVVPQVDWALWSHLLIQHGRAVCKSQKPVCRECLLLSHCPHGQKVMRQKPGANRSAPKNVP